MTLVWFVIWVIADHIGDRAPLLADPVNLWTTTLLLAIALDLSRQHATGLRAHGGDPENGHGHSGQAARHR